LKLTPYTADLHIHTVASPCADLDMSPRNIVATAIEKKLNIIGITDHNCTLQCQTVKQIAQTQSLFVMCGAEVTSRDEVHCLTFFESESELNQFQQFINVHLPKMPNDTKLFGYQVLVDENDYITNEIEYYLGNALNVGINEIEAETHRLNGLFIPAHINRPRFGLISQLGFVPPDIKADAFELFNKTSTYNFCCQNPNLSSFSFIKNSDAHFLQNIGFTSLIFHLNELTYNEIKMALHKVGGRYLECV
jgi:3',5'-nucleoside bisphosphate phosphatase